MAEAPAKLLIYGLFQKGRVLAQDGMFAGLAAGYRFGPRLRVEVEWFYRESEYDQTSPVTSATGDTFAKLGGEIQRAEDRIGSISSQNVFANVYVDFPGRTRLTPLCLLFIHPGAPNLISLRSAGTIPA